MLPPAETIGNAYRQNHVATECPICDRPATNCYVADGFVSCAFCQNSGEIRQYRFVGIDQIDSRRRIFVRDEGRPADRSTAPPTAPFLPDAASLNADQIAAQLALFIHADQYTEMRARADDGRVFAGWYDGRHLRDLARAALGMHRTCRAVQFVPNPIVPEVAKRRLNTVLNVRPGTISLTHDADILEQRYLLIDLDPVRATGGQHEPTTDAELAAAREVATAVEADMIGRGWARPVWMMSGNGIHLVYRTEGQEGDLRGLLDDLDRRFSSDRVKIDTNTGNPSRMLKVPGTLSRKGTASPDRPHRLACAIQLPGDWAQPAAPPTEPVRRPEPERICTAPVTRRPSEPASVDDVRARAIAYLAKLPPAIQGEGGSAATMRAARCMVWGFDLGEDDGLELLIEHYNPRCQPAWSERDLAKKCRDAMTGGREPRGYLLDAEQPSRAGTGRRGPATEARQPTQAQLDPLEEAIRTERRRFEHTPQCEKPFHGSFVKPNGDGLVPPLRCRTWDCPGCAAVHRREAFSRFTGFLGADRTRKLCVVEDGALDEALKRKLRRIGAETAVCRISLNEELGTTNSAPADDFAGVSYSLLAVVSLPAGSDAKGLPLVSIEPTEAVKRFSVGLDKLYVRRNPDGKRSRPINFSREWCVPSPDDIPSGLTYLGRTALPAQEVIAAAQTLDIATDAVALEGAEDLPGPTIGVHAESTAQTFFFLFAATGKDRPVPPTRLELISQCRDWFPLLCGIRGEGQRVRELIRRHAWGIALPSHRQAFEHADQADRAEHEEQRQREREGMAATAAAEREEQRRTISAWLEANTTYEATDADVADLQRRYLADCSMIAVGDWLARRGWASFRVSRERSKQ
jgi:hypothetical protein